MSSRRNLLAETSRRFRRFPVHGAGSEPRRVAIGRLLDRLGRPLVLERLPVVVDPMPKLRINIDEIGEEGLDLEETLGQAWVERVLAEGQPTPFTAAGPLAVVAHLDKVDAGFLLDASMSPRLATGCRRCLKPVQVTVPTRFNLSLIPRAEVARRLGEEDDRGPEAAPRGSFDPSEVDEETFEGRAIDLEPILREQLLLALPMDALCREGCKGLCPACGQDLNERTCGCAVERPDPRWEKLRTLKLSN